MNLSINFTEQQIKQIQQEDQAQESLHRFVRLCETWEIAEKIGYVLYRKTIKKYLS